ncbi:MAG: cupin domain-containing protein [Actinomycetota bacterium]|jgi:quercetin dioxygenase-like cupin family protein
MPVIRRDQAPMFELGGVRVRGGASPSRGADEVLLFRVILENDAAMPRHTHDHDEVYQVVSGSVTAVIGDESFEVTEGDTVVIPAGAQHEAFVDGGRRTEFVSSMLKGTVMIRPNGERVAPPWTE